jgi:hypothetical protein
MPHLLSVFICIFFSRVETRKFLNWDLYIILQEFLVYFAIKLRRLAVRIFRMLNRHLVIQYISGECVLTGLV